MLHIHREIASEQKAAAESKAAGVLHIVSEAAAESKAAGVMHIDKKGRK